MVAGQPFNFAVTWFSVLFAHYAEIAFLCSLPALLYFFEVCSQRLLTIAHINRTVQQILASLGEEMNGITPPDTPGSDPLI